MADKLVGRKKEKQILQKILQSKEAEFVAIYGRRRVGKTYLVRHFFKDKPCIFFQLVGIKDASMNELLTEFKKMLENVFYSHLGMRIETPKSWIDAFDLLTRAIKEFAKQKKVVLFFDELPWLASKRSGFLQALDYYWNGNWVDNPGIKLIVCGSAASWMINKIINAKGGLHNRVTKQVFLEPFTLNETKNYLQYLEVKLNNQQVTELYMALGGVPYYLRQIEPGLSAIQNINKLCFQKHGVLYTEFQRLFASLFDHAVAHEELIYLISKKREGIGRSELFEKAKLSTDGGRLTDRLDELEKAGFIKFFIPGYKKRGIYYKIIDEYTLFYLTWLKPIQNEIVDAHYWEAQAHSPAYKSWSGYSYELICYKHISAIMHKLKIPYGSKAASWRQVAAKASKVDGAQIDLFFDRPDGIITICEIKYTDKPFKIDKEYAGKLLNKVKVFKSQTKTKKQIFIAMISANGIQPSIYSEELICGVVALEDLFAR